MEPVKIKYWGMFRLSKTGYLLFNGLGWLAVILMVVALVAVGVLPPLRVLWQSDPAWPWGRWLWWALLASLAAQFIDAAVAWRKFAKAEEEQRREYERRRQLLDEFDDAEPPVDRSDGITSKPRNVRAHRD